MDENLGDVDENDMKDHFKAKKICILNPTFGEVSQLVGGTDCDFVIDDAIIDIKNKEAWREIILIS